MVGELNEQALRRLVDRGAIVDLVHRYSFLVDTQRFDELMELFTDDCVTDYGPGVGGVREGKPAVRAMFGTRFLATSHHNANVMVTFLDDHTATVQTSVYAWHRFGDGRTGETWGFYFDLVRRTADGWRLARRELRQAGNRDMDFGWHPLVER